jgi:hypothetical protein
MTSQRYNSRIIKAGALLADAKAFLRAYDESLSLEENLRRLRTANVFGKTSRRRVAAILPIFRQRFCDDKALASPLRRLARGNVPDDVLDRILYFHTVRQDALLGDFVRGFLGERSRGSDPLVRPGEARRAIAALLAPEGQSWSEETLERVTQGVLATLRDFRILSGAVHKRISPPHLPVEAFVYVAFALHRRESGGQRLLEHPDWGLFLLRPPDVERLLLEAQRHRLLNFQSVGQLVRIDFTATSLEGLVDVLVA